MSQSECPLLRNVYNKNAYFSGNGVKTSLVSVEMNMLGLENQDYGRGDPLR
jgi:hypothetical protein